MSESLRVVLVDDSRTVLAQLESLLEEIEGVELVGTAVDGADAIRMVDGTKPDLVLLDLVMPGIDGLSALRVLQANYPDLRVAVLSSAGGAATRAEEAFRLGAVQVLGKPIEPDLIRALFEREISQKREALKGSWDTLS
ncbi:MAG: response regulator [Myxococcota bacterium]|nr:response regulator [Myxococcota bacterium]